MHVLSISGARNMYDHFDVYLKALGNDGYFYRKPLQGSAIRYGKQPLGVNKLESLMKEMCTKAGLEGNYSNHSGKRTCATSLYNAGLDEQSIMDRTGHRSNAVRAYKTKTNEVERRVSAALNPPNDTENIDIVALPDKRVKFEVESDEKMKTRKSLNDITNTSGTVNFNNCNFTIS